METTADTPTNIRDVFKNLIERGIKPDDIALIYSHAMEEMAKHSKPSQETKDRLDRLEKKHNDQQEAIQKHIEFNGKLVAFVERLMAEDMEQQIAWGFFKRKALKTNSTLHSIADFSKTLGSVAVVFYAIYHFAISYIIK